MSKLARYIIVIVVATLITFGVFTALGKIIEPSPVHPSLPLNTEVTFEKEYTKDNFERPLAPDTKGRGYQIFEPPNFPEPKYVDTICNLEGVCEDIKFYVTDDGPRFSDPITQYPPIMPEDAYKSGSCTFVVTFNEKGTPLTITEMECSDKIFIKPTQQAAIKWRFRPQIKDGKPISYSSGQQKVVYRLLDENGNIIPE